MTRPASHFAVVVGLAGLVVGPLMAAVALVAAGWLLHQGDLAAAVCVGMMLWPAAGIWILSLDILARVTPPPRPTVPARHPASRPHPADRPLDPIELAEWLQLEERLQERSE